MRLDCFIAQQLEHISRQKAIELIKQGQVFVNHKLIKKPSYIVTINDDIQIKQDFFIESAIFCSRAALKLQRFLSNTSPTTCIYAYYNTHFLTTQTTFLTYLKQYVDINKWLQSHIPIHTYYMIQTESTITTLKHTLRAMIKDSIILDVGASAGGFTQVLLAYGAKLVVAQDIGNLQLDSKLRQRDDVLSIENVDIRIFAQNFHTYKMLIASHLQAKKNECVVTLPEIPTNMLQFLVCDVSFIALEYILDALHSLCKSMILLFKPQYEVGIHIKRNKKGVVQDKQAILQSLESFIQILKKKQAHYIFIEQSLLAGKEGNEEFFIFCQF